MAFPLPRGITPSEIEFLSEMELVTVVPRQRLEGLELLAVSVSNLPAIYPPQKKKADLHSAFFTQRLLGNIPLM